MKKEMKMKDNGNYEEVISPIQHECIPENRIWRCIDYHWKDSIILTMEDGDRYEDGCFYELEVKYCPFCGYTREKK